MPLNRAKFHFDTIYGDMNVTIGPYLLYQAGDLCCEPGYRVPPHRQLVYEITYVAEGTGTNSTNGRGQPMSRGDVFVNRIGELHEMGKVGHGSRVLVVGFGGGLTWGGALVEFA